MPQVAQLGGGAARMCSQVFLLRSRGPSPGAAASLWWGCSGLVGELSPPSRPDTGEGGVPENISLLNPTVPTHLGPDGLCFHSSAYWSLTFFFPLKTFFFFLALLRNKTFQHNTAAPVLKCIHLCVHQKMYTRMFSAAPCTTAISSARSAQIMVFSHTG